MPGHTFLYSPPVNMIRDLIDGGELGEIYSISTSRVNLGLHQPDASVAWDLGEHNFLDSPLLARRSPEPCRCAEPGLHPPGNPPTSHSSTWSINRARSHTSNCPGLLRRATLTTIIGSEKMIVYDDTSTEPVRIFDSGVMIREPTSYGEFKLSYRTGDIVSPRVEAAEPLYREIGGLLPVGSHRSLATLVMAARARRRPGRRGSRSVPRSSGCTSGSRARHSGFRPRPLAVFRAAVDLEAPSLLVLLSADRRCGSSTGRRSSFAIFRRWGTTAR